MIWQKKRRQESFLHLVCLSDDLYLFPNENENSSYAAWPLRSFSQLHHDEMMLYINICFYCVPFPYVSFQVTNFSSLFIFLSPVFPSSIFIFFLNYTSSVLLSLISVTLRRNLYAWERNEDTYFCFFPIFVAFCKVTSYLCWKGPLWWLCHTVSAIMDSKLNEFQCWCRRHSFTCVSDRNGQGRTF